MKRIENNARQAVRNIRLVTLIGVFVAIGGVVASACNVPVFRYALERWRPDPYRVTVFHRGPLSDAQSALLRPLENGGAAAGVASAKGASANVELRVVDVDDLDDAARKLFDAQTSPQLPWMVVQYPQSSRIEMPVWSGPLADGSTARLVDSPLRKELIRRLVAGQTAVWMMLECGDAAKDDAVAKQLEDELKKLTKTLELPELTSAPEDSLLSDAPLNVAFSLLRVPRGVAAEQSLVDVMLHSEPDLMEFAEPMVFPVFGRGRALLPLIGAGITPDNIHESAAFLVGACSCEVKELNPGFDLLLTADWDGVLFADGPPPAILATRSTVVPGKPELVAIPRGATPALPVATSVATPGATPVATTVTEESALEFHYEAVPRKYTIVIGLGLVAVFGVLVMKLIGLVSRRKP